jgi:hypothetical protein
MKKAVYMVTWTPLAGIVRPSGRMRSPEWVSVCESRMANWLPILALDDAAEVATLLAEVRERSWPSPGRSGSASSMPTFTANGMVNLKFRAAEHPQAVVVPAAQPVPELA